MNKKVIGLLIAIFLLGTAVTLTACSQWQPPYPSLNEDGYTISVRFDANGGRMKGRNDVTVVEVFRMEDAVDCGNGEKTLKLLDPESSERPDAGKITVTNPNHFLAGWYTERKEVTDENGEFDHYEYSGKWDFETDTVLLQADGEYSADTPVVTLYAAWIPYFNYCFQVQNTLGEWEQLDTKSLINLDIPTWDEGNVRPTMGNFVNPSDRTFDGAYLDPDCTIPLQGTLMAEQLYVDYEKGIATANTISIYTKWLDGVWYKIYTAQQFVSNSRSNANYLIYADLDFSDQTWAPSMTSNPFTGSIQGAEGQTYKFSNIKITQGASNTVYFGLFGRLAESAVIENVIFENVTCNINMFLRIQNELRGGLLSGWNAGATLNNIEINGTLNIGGEFNELNDDKYALGLLFGYGSASEIDLSGIQCIVEEGCRVTVEVDDVTGAITIQLPSEDETDETDETIETN